MKALVRVAAAAVVITSISSAAIAQDCRGLTGWGRYNCLAQNQPDQYVRCNELGIARGYSNRAPGRASFIMACMSYGRRMAVGAPVQRTQRPHQQVAGVITSDQCCGNVGKFSATAAETASNFDSSHPFCIRSPGGSGGPSCYYASYQQCNAAASGTMMICMQNPNYNTERKSPQPSRP
jgi:hypothetical protein